MSTHLVLLHGLGRTARSMAPLARAAERRGYVVLNVGYPSRAARVAELAVHVSRAIQRFAPEVPALDVVTHSMGAILLRAAVDAGLLPLGRIRRVVMLAPPNEGSEAADFVGRIPLLGRVPGPALRELGTGPGAVPGRLGPIEFDCGVIAGSRTVNPILSLAIPGPNDGKVAIARAGAPGVRALLVVPHSHPFIMRAARVHREVFHYLNHGRFASPDVDDQPD